MPNHPLTFIVGPSAVGKSAWALELARQIDGEIINADAMQVYREIRIASDKPSNQIRQEIPHHLLDIVSLTERFDVAQYRQLALDAIKQIDAKGKTPIVVGGSGMYIQVLLDGIFELPSGIDFQNHVARLEKEAEVKGVIALYDRLKQHDPQAAMQIHPNDLKRILRALSVYEATGKTITHFKSLRAGLWETRPINYIGLNRPREVLYDRCHERINRMIAEGLIEEIQSLEHLEISPTAATLIGIPEIKGYIKGQYDLAQAVYLLKRNTRHLIKKQLTWFRHDDRIAWTMLE